MVRLLLDENKRKGKVKKRTMSSNYKELRKNTFIIAVANLGSKLISFILAPLYSYYMTTSEYGTMDLINTTLGLLVPLICLDIFEATFRYASDQNHDSSKVLTNSIIVCIPGAIVCFFIPVLSQFIHLDKQILLVLSMCFVVEVFNYVISQFLRGMNRMVQFASYGIVGSVGMLVSNVVFLFVLKMGLYGWIYSLLVSRIVGTIYLLYISNFFSYFTFRSIDKEYIREFIKFCFPLMPTATMWWVMNLSDRYMLAFFFGTAEIGIYAVANKIPALVSVFENIFYQAWLTTAIKAKDDRDRDKIYSNVFNNYLIVLIIGMLGVLLIGKVFVTYLFEKSYSDAYKYIPILLIGVIIHALNGNLGSLYSVFKKTEGALYSTALGAATNIILNLIFIPKLGIWGAAITTSIGYIVTLLYRWYDVKKFVSIKIDAAKLLFIVPILAVQLAAYSFNGYVFDAARGVVLAIAIYKYRGVIFSLMTRH